MLDEFKSRLGRIRAADKRINTLIDTVKTGLLGHNITDLRFFNFYFLILTSCKYHLNFKLNRYR